MQNCHTLWRGQGVGITHHGHSLASGTSLLPPEVPFEGSGIEVHMSIRSNKQEVEQAGFLMGSFVEAGNTPKHEGMVKRSYCCAY